MTKRRCTLAFSILFITGTTLLGIPSRAHAQAPAEPQAAEAPEGVQTEASAQQALTTAQIQAQATALNLQTQAEKASQRQSENSKAKFNDNNSAIWTGLMAVCSPPGATSPVSDGCATDALYAALNECEASARYFRKASKGWQTINLAVISVSALSTAFGASSLIANTKLLSTLGGSTGLLATQTVLNANSSGDQSALASVNSTITTLTTFIQGAAGNKTDPDTIFRSARAYGAQCAAAANGTSTTTPNSKGPANPKSGSGGSL